MHLSKMSKWKSQKLPKSFQTKNSKKKGNLITLLLFQTSLLVQGWHFNILLRGSSNQFRNYESWFISQNLLFVFKRKIEKVPIKVIIKKSRREPFLWNRIWDLGWLAILKQSFGPLTSNFWGRFFNVFIGKKKLNIF